VAINNTRFCISPVERLWRSYVRNTTYNHCQIA
jgi:hypothetical protein